MKPAGVFKSGVLNLENCLETDPLVKHNWGMVNRLSTDQRAQIVSCLCEGMSIRATTRVTGSAKNTITKLLVELGAACAAYQDAALFDLPCNNIQCDEIWSFCYSKQKNVPDEHQGEFGYGDVWTWTAICADTKLVPSWLVGERPHSMQKCSSGTWLVGSPTESSSPPTACACT